MEPVGRVEATATGAGSAASQPAVPVGAGGNLFEIPGAPGGRALVIKIFPWALGLPGEVMQNLTDEARRVASLHHPHVVPVIDAGCLRDGTPFVVIDRLRGQTLEERLALRGPPPLAEAMAIVRGAASALAVAHALGVVHREIRADNVFIEEVPGHPGGVPRLLDFGVACLGVAARAAGRVVREAPPDEVAPEVRAERGAGGDQRADQFALAALAHRLLHGAVAPYGAPGGPAFQRLWDHGAGAAAIGAGPAAAVDGVLARAMSWRPDARYPSVAAFAHAFEEALSGAAAVVVPAPAPIVAPAPVPAVAPAPIVAVRPELVPASFAPRPVPYAPPGVPPMSLTQQFFAEGDRLEALSQRPVPAATSAVVPRKAPPARTTAPSRPRVVPLREAPASSGTFDRVPRRRSPFIGAALLVLAALAILARTVFWQMLHH